MCGEETTSASPLGGRQLQPAPGSATALEHAHVPENILERS